MPSNLLLNALRIFGYLSLCCFALAMAVGQLTWAWMGIFATVFGSGSLCALFPRIIDPGLTREQIRPYSKPFVLGAVFVAAMTAVSFF